jgi:hypothetical protein
MRRIMSLLAVLAIPACSGDGGGGGDSEGAAKTVSDFLLVDQNPNTPTYQASVSPRDYLGRVPGFYFTRAN